MLVKVMTVDRFGVVCAFVTNEYLQHGTKNLPNDIRSSIHDTDLYLNNTKKVSSQSRLLGAPTPSFLSMLAMKVINC